MELRVLAPTDRISRHYAQRIRQILSRFNDIRDLIQHEGMKGTRVEREVRKFLTDFLPERYQYSSGIVIDNSGGECDRSRQEDILIIDRFFNPKLFLDEEPSVYPVEVVYCGIEVKTSIDSNELQQSIRNIASLKRLKFIREQITFTRGNSLTVSETTGPIGIIFAFDTTIRTAETILKHVAATLENIERQAWPNLICIMNRGIIGINQEGKPAFQLFGLLGKDYLGQEGEIIIANPVNEIAIQGQIYPVINMDRKYYVVDVARTFTALINYLYDLLLGKIIVANSNLLRHYIPDQMTRSLGFVHQEDKN